MINQEYEKAEQAVRDKYWEKGKKILKNGLIAMTVPVIIGITSFGIGTVKYLNLDKNIPIAREYKANQNSLSYLRERLNLLTHPLPEYLSPQTRSDLEKLEIIDSAKISGLERAIKVAQDDSSRIVNTSEFKEWGYNIENINSYTYASVGMFSLFALPALATGIMLDLNDRKKKKEVKSLKESYGIKE